MKKIYFLLLTLMTMLLFSCKSEDELTITNVTKFYTAAGQVCLLNEETIQYLEQTIEEGAPIVFSSSTPDEALPKIGTIIVIPESEKSPYGFLGKVVKVEKGYKITVTTEEVSLEEAFENLSIDTEFNLEECFEGVYDEEGNPIEYQLVDSLFQEPDTINPSSKAETRATRTGEFYLENHIVSFPVNLFKDKAGNAGVEVTGTAYVGFKKAKLDIDCVDHKLKYVNFEASPVAGLKLSDKVTVEKEAKVEECIGQLRFKPKFLVPVGPLPVPVIVPITFYLYGEFGVKGEATATLTFKTEWNPTWKVELKNDKWVVPEEKGEHIKKTSPWGVEGEFAVNGEIYSKSKFGALVGLYTATSGIGINLCPTYSVSLNANLNSELLKINPKVEQEIALNSDVYCVAKVFGKNLAKFEMNLPKFVLWSEKLYLLPQYENFEAYGNSTNGEISYQVDQHYFLEGKGVKPGASVFENDEKTLIKSYFPSPTSTNNRGYKSYNVSVSGLRGGETYYASPVVELPFNIPAVGKYLYGDKKEFTTEASYNLGFRCTSQSYDVISFTFDLNNKNGNTIDYTTEATDYSGQPMRVHVTATYNSTTKQLDGIFDFYFYNDPSQQRKDGFSVSLANDDSGYVDCSKIVDNEGCYAALRIYKSSNTRAAKRQYAKPLIDDDCNIGVYNKYWKK